MKTAKKHEMLKYAYDNYPKGTKFRNHATEAEVESIGSFKVGDLGIVHDNIDIRGGNTILFLFEGSQSYAGKWAEIITEKTAPILDVKCAIQVNNEREFKLLMDHYHNKGWRTGSGNPVNFLKYNTSTGVNSIIAYHDGFFGGVKDHEGYTIIHFSNFAKEVGITVRTFIMKSEDGVDLYEGDYYQLVKNIPATGNKWEICIKNAIIGDGDFVVVDPEHCKAFSTLESANKWIEEQNKPKKITIPLGGAGLIEAIIGISGVTIKHGLGGIINISSYELNKMFKAYQQLQEL